MLWPIRQGHRAAFGKGRWLHFRRNFVKLGYAILPTSSQLLVVCLFVVARGFFRVGIVVLPSGSLALHENANPVLGDGSH